MYVSLVRHAIAQERDEFCAQGGVDDELRPLTKKGIDRMIKNSRGIYQLCGPAALIATSPLTRAVETTEILKSQYKQVNIETWQELKPEYESEDVIKKLQNCKNDEHIILVGHEPNLTEFINFSLTLSSMRISHMKKGGLCTLYFDSTPAKGTAQLSCWIQPSRLRAMAKNLKTQEHDAK